MTDPRTESVDLARRAREARIVTEARLVSEALRLRALVARVRRNAAGRESGDSATERRRGP